MTRAEAAATAEQARAERDRIQLAEADDAVRGYQEAMLALAGREARS
jgi:hypothetical protein